MKRFKNILASVDTRASQHPALQWAAVLAEHNKARLKIVDTLPAFPWHVRLAMRGHEQIHGTLLKEKSDKLQQLAETLSDKGLQVSTKVLAGQSSVEITREVMRDQHDLVVRISKGPDSRRSGFFGNTSIQLLRKCPCPVWIVKPDTTPKFQHILGAVDPASHDDQHVSLNNEIIELARAIAAAEDSQFSIIHAWSIYGEQMLKSRMQAEDFEELEVLSCRRVEDSLNKLLEAHGLSVRDDNVLLVRGEPAHAIPQFVASHDVDLLVMGTVGRSGFAGITMGNTAELTLDRVRCAVLALKPQDFESPIKV